MRILLFYIVLLCSCRKAAGPPPPAPASDKTAFVKYTIRAGAHFADQNNYKAVETDELNFTVRFDSSAIYQSCIALNQYDINKLYGFSDNGGRHHDYSARFGWRWSAGALRLFAYVYNAGAVVSKELATVRIGAEVPCRIKVMPDSYLFYCAGQLTALPRKSATAKGKGYLLYPYFGGDEAAPHDIAIWIKNE